MKIKSIQCGVISDVSGNDDDEWDSTLSAMLSSVQTNHLNPFEHTGKIVEFYVEKFIPEL